MPGPIYVPGAKNTSGPPPPKPIVRPWVAVPDLAETTPTVLPATVTEAWRGFWHAIGSNLPYYVNHSRASRRALRSFGRAHG